MTGRRRRRRTALDRPGVARSRDVSTGGVGVPWGGNDERSGHGGGEEKSDAGEEHLG